MLKPLCVSPRNFLAASLLSSLLMLGASAADAGFLPTPEELDTMARAAAAKVANVNADPGDTLKTRNDTIFNATLEALKKAGFDEVGNSLPLPPMGRPAEEVELKAVAWEDVANLRLLGHANMPLKLLMVLTGNFRQDTRDEVRQVLDVVKQINEEAGMPPHNERLKLQLIISSESDFHSIDLSAEELREHVEINRYFQSKDVWMQDWGEIGAVLVDGADKERQVVFDSNRGRGLEGLPESLARQWNGHFIDGPPGHGAGNYGGNIEVTPDDYLVIGDSSSGAIRKMFADMGYQDRTCVLATKWLLVGHVDEYISFLPTPDTPLGYTILKADPKQAMDLIKATPSETFGFSLGSMMNSAFRKSTHYPEMLSMDKRGFQAAFDRVGAIHSGLHGTKMDLGGIDSDTLLAMNHEASQIIEAEVARLVAFLQSKHGADTPVPVVSVPTLFHKSRGRFAALTPGVANMVVLKDHLIIPDPLLPEFQGSLRQSLPALGYKPHLIPNLTYHIGVGQLHCGTNTFRHPNKYVHPRFAEIAARRVKAAKRRAKFRAQ